MSAAYAEEVLLPSCPTSPNPRRQTMMPLSTNQRSYSRVSSKGIFGDESPLLLSPMPKYPNRRRSITFADSTEAVVREERPHYTVWEIGATPNARRLERSCSSKGCISKLRSGENAAGVNTNVGVSQQHQEQNSQLALVSGSPTLQRARSNSRQRRAARRQQAQLHYGFYDDSIVEEYIFKARKELEEEEQRERLEEDLKRQEKEKMEAEKRAVEASVKISALQHAKEYLLSTSNAIRLCSMYSNSEPRDDVVSDASSGAPRLCHYAPGRELNLLQGVDEKENEGDEIQVTTRKQTSRSGNCSMPLVTPMDEADGLGSRKRPRDISSSKLNLSLRSVQQDHNYKKSNDKSDDDDDDESGLTAKRRKAKLERIVARVLEQQAKRRHGKRSVVVIDWDSAEAEEMLLDTAFGVGDEEDDEDEVGSPPPLRKRKSVARKKVTDDVTVVPQPKQRRVQGAPATRSATTRAPSIKTCTASLSVPPDLGEELILEEEQPMLLRRTTAKKNARTRSLSHLSTETGDNVVFEQAVNISRKPPTRVQAKKTSMRGRVATTSAPTVEAPPFVPPPSHRYTSVRRDAFLSVDAPEPLGAAPPPVRHRRKSVTASKPPVDMASVSPDDPMAVFYGADFPSPSKFNEMMLAAGCLPESRRTGRGQPALMLPTTISRYHY